MMSFYFIDDDKNICNILKLIINERGLGVCCGSANNAAEALEDLPSAKPDIVIVDLLMPEMDGIQALKEIKKIDGGAKVIMCSAMGQQAMVIEAIQNGAKDFIVKPFQADRVLEAVKKVIG